MPGTEPRVKPPSATDLSFSEEGSQLELNLQRQFEEDIARIFDESIYSDVEVVCGKLKILTHSCILKARTNKFYHKLETILHVEIARSTFDEIYSFISDTYTECNIKKEEKEILKDLKKSLKTKEEIDRSQEFLTPKCENPYSYHYLKKSHSSSLCTELKKEYYELVPRESNLFDKELIEQDVLSNAFQSIINSQVGDSEYKNLQRNKPTSLTLVSSHTSKSVKHSNSCDILNKNNHTNENQKESNKFQENKSSTKSSQIIKSKEVLELNESNDLTLNKIKTCDFVTDGNFETTYSPDSLITDDLSSASDYLSAAYTCSARVCSVEHAQVIVDDNINRMDNLFTSLDSGLENTGLLESLTSHKDATLTDMSLTESVKDISVKVHDFTTNDSINYQATPSNSNGERRISLSINPNSFANTSSYDKISPENKSQITNAPVKHREITNCNSSKEEKQRQNEEIVILESSSVSSETGSWESVFPPKLETKEVCEKFIINERQHYTEIKAEDKDKTLVQRDICPSHHQKSRLKSTSCFIDAASLIDDEDGLLKSDLQHHERFVTFNSNVCLLTNLLTEQGSKPLPCSVNKSDLSPNDWSENDDSLNTDSIQKDLSSTIFEMTLVPEDSRNITLEPHLSPKNKEFAIPIETSKSNIARDTKYSLPSTSVSVISTPHNSILSIKASNKHENDKSESDIFIENRDEQKNNTKSSHKFYVDLSSLPDPEMPKIQSESERSNEKKHIFSMFFDFGEKSTVKEMPSRLSTLNTKKTAITESKPNLHKNQKTRSNNECSTSLASKSLETNSPNFFEVYEDLCEDPNISISEIINLRQVCRQNEIKKYNLQSKSLSGDYTFHSSLRPPIEKVELKGQEDALFVKLSDLDKPVSKADTSVGKDATRILDKRMTRSIPENNWSDQNQAVSSRSNEVISSFHSENAQSLNRLFPHLRNEFSRSMPGSLSSISNPGDIEDETYETSEMSSVQSSICRSIIENSTTEETSQGSSLIGNCQSRLGQDLLRMFLEEIAPDVIVEVSGRRIKAHKCILSSRCQYFAGILSGGWVESAGNVISLPTFSFIVVHFALCHIYSGVSTIPDSISIVELATLTDLLGLEGLKEAIMFTLKSKYCHHFHRPCAVCKAGVLECFPLTSIYGLDDLYRKCLKWISKYFSLVWPTKAFATLPSELLEKSYQQVVFDLSLENCIDTACGCGLAVSMLNRSRWADVVTRMCHRVARATANFMAPKLVAVLRNIEMLAPDRAYSAIQALDECIRAAIACAPPEELCRTYNFIADVVKETRNFRFTKPDLLSNGNIPGRNSLLYSQANSWLLECEKYIVKDATRVCCTQAYTELSSDARKRLQELGCIKRPTLPSEHYPVLLNKRSRNSPHSKSGKSQTSTQPSMASTNNLDIDQMRVCFVPYSLKPPPQNPEHNNLIVQEHKKPSRSTAPKVKTTKAQEKRAQFNLMKTTLSQERLNIKQGKPLEKAKPRYMKPKFVQDNHKKLSVPKLVSSSQTSIQSRGTLSVKIRHVEQTQTSDPETQALLRNNTAAHKTNIQTLSPDISVVRPRTKVHEQALSHDSLASSSQQRIDIQGTAQDVFVKCSQPRYETQSQVLPQDKSMPSLKSRDEIQPISQNNCSSSRSRPKVSEPILSQHSVMPSSRPKTESIIQTVLEGKMARASRPCNEVLASTLEESMFSSRPNSGTQVQVLPEDNLTIQSQPCIGIHESSQDNLLTSSQSCSKMMSQTVSQNSLVTSSPPHTNEPSTDPLSESQNNSKYATYTKKHTVKGIDNSRKNKDIQTRVINQMVRSKIPIYLNQASKARNLNQGPIQIRSPTSSTSATTSTTTSSVQSRSKIHDKTSCSLMNATKSSSAKMVTKAKGMKENTRAKPVSKNKGISERPQPRSENESQFNIPIMERSGTFSKDEPTFRDKSHLLATDDTDYIKK